MTQQTDARVITKYLERYAEPEASVGARFTRPTDHILVIPAHNESASMLNGLQTALKTVHHNGQRALCIVVVNATNQHGSTVHTCNDKLIVNLKNVGPSVSLHRTGETPCWYIDGATFDLLLIDRNSAGHRLPKREGVGLARKIGCDVALSSIQSTTTPARLIHTSDCDVCLPETYFDVEHPPSCAAVIYPFRHIPCGSLAIDEAHAYYEAYLRYYVLGLRYAQSVYDFHSIGSCIAVRPITYAQVRGVPKREAGEDFYLLNKLAKLGAIHTAQTEPIRIRSRVSARVPFGTGRSTHDIARSTTGYAIYDPTIFNLLRAWNTALPALDDASPNHAYASVYQRAVQYLNADTADRLDTALRSLDAPTALREAAAQSTAPAVRRKWLHDWFDGFRTLKLVHNLRDNGLPNIPWADAIASASFCKLRGETKNTHSIRSKRDPFDLCRRLARLEERI